MEHWIEVAIDTNPEGIDLVGSVLTALDVTGFVIEDETDFLTFWKRTSPHGTMWMKG